MNQSVECLDCKTQFEVYYDILNDLNGSQPLTDDRIAENIKNIEELTNFNVKKNICLDCLVKLTKKKEEQNNIIKEEIDSMRKAVSSLTDEIQTKEFQDILKINENDLRTEEEKLKKDLERLMYEETNAEKDLKELSEKLKQLTTDEEKYWMEFNNLERDIFLYTKENSYLKNRMTNYERDIKSFATDVMNDLFNISYTDNYGTINGSRMGMDDSNNIHCDEINAGWGYIVHLTIIIARKLNYEFKTYELVAMGNYSKLISKSNDNRTYELTSYSNYRNLEKFNSAQLAYMEVFHELYKHLVQSSQYKKYLEIIESKLETYDVTKQGINKNSINLDKNNSGEWTQCMKYLLTILKIYILMIAQIDKDNYRDILDKSLIINNV